MGGAFSTDGAADLFLGEHAFATPAAARLNLLTAPPARPALVLDSGGGILRLQVTACCRRETLGDAERWVHDTLCALAVAGPGVLGLADAQGKQATFADAVCVSGEGRVRAFRFAELEIEFAAPERPQQPPWQEPPAAPHPHPGTSDAQDYAAGGTALGTHPAGLRIEMTRRFPLRQVPRCRGARPAGPPSGAALRFVVTSHALCAGSNLADYLQELAARIGHGPVTLTGNGNTWEGAVLESLRPAHTPKRHTRFEAMFLTEITT